MDDIQATTETCKEKTKLRKPGKAYSSRHLKLIVKRKVEEAKLKFKDTYPTRVRAAVKDATSKTKQTIHNREQIIPLVANDPTLTPTLDTTPAITNYPHLITENIFPTSDSLSCTCSALDFRLGTNNGKLNTFRENLTSWVVEHNISQNSYTKLLSILRTDLGIPIYRDARTLLKTSISKTTLQFIKMSNGLYYHFDLRDSVNFILTNCKADLNNVGILKLEINIDGLPLTKSSNSQFWPILGNFENLNQADFVFPIGVFHGTSKPLDPNEFVKYFVDDFLRLKQTGVTHNGKFFDIEITKILCDAPAKSFILCVKGHNAYNGCTKCITEGSFINNRMTYPDINATLRTDADFKYLNDEDFHKSEPTNLLKLEIGLISSTPLDYMHLVCLGVVKRLITFWVKGNHSVRFFNSDIEEINKKIHMYRRSCVLEFARKPRSLNDVDHWKATEFRQFLLYYGPIVIKPHLRQDKFLHFLCLHCAVRILASSQLCRKYNTFADILLRHFVEHFSDFYGAEYINHNIHNLIHLPKDVLKYGPLDKFSCFKFENFMSMIKKSIKSSRLPLEQFVRRTYENREFLKRHFHEDYKLVKLLDSKSINNNVVQTYYGINFCNIKLRLSNSNCYILLKNGSPAKIFDIFESDKKIFIRYKKFLSFHDYFTEPCSSKLFFCGKVKNLSEVLEVASIDDILHKAMLIDNFFVTLIH